MVPRAVGCARRDCAFDVVVNLCHRLELDPPAHRMKLRLGSLTDCYRLRD